MGRIVVILTLLLSGCASSLESDNEFQGKYQIQRIEAYNALTNDLITTISGQDLYLIRISRGQYVELRMELNGEVIWRFEGNQEDIKQTLEWQRMTLPPNFISRDIWSASEYNLSKFESMIFARFNFSDYVMVFENGDITNTLNGLVDDDVQIKIYMYMTDIA